MSIVRVPHVPGIGAVYFYRIDGTGVHNGCYYKPLPAFASSGMQAFIKYM